MNSRFLYVRFVDENTFLFDATGDGLIGNWVDCLSHLIVVGDAGIGDRLTIGIQNSL